MVTKDTPLNELFDLAYQSANEVVRAGEKFRVKDLFRGVEWQRVPKGFRTKLGFMFYAYVTEQASDTFELAGKTPQNQQMYLKLMKQGK